MVAASHQADGVQTPDQPTGTWASHSLLITRLSRLRGTFIHLLKTCSYSSSELLGQITDGYSIMPCAKVLRGHKCIKVLKPPSWQRIKEHQNWATVPPGSHDTWKGWHKSKSNTDHPEQNWACLSKLLTAGSSHATTDFPDRESNPGRGGESAES